MTASDRDDDDALLGMLLAGERQADDPEIRALFARRPEAELEVQRLRSLDRRLSEAAGQERAMRAEAAASAPTSAMKPDAAWLAKAAREHLRPRRAWRAWLVAAALVALGVAIAWLAFPATKSPDHMLGPVRSGTIECTFVDGRPTFRWNLERPADGYFVVRIYAGDPGGNPAREQNTGSESAWTPAPHLLDSLTGPLFWEVAVKDRTGRDTRSGAGPQRIPAPR